MKQLIVLLLTGVWVGRVTALPDQFTASCDPRCKCNKTAIICVESHYTSTDIFLFMKPEIYEDLDTVVVTGNEMDSIDDSNLFGQAVTHLRLTALNLSSNYLRTIDASAFSGLPRLEILDLSNNDLEAIEGDLLGRFPLLHSIHLTAAFDRSLNGTETADMLYRMFHESVNKFTHLESIELDSNALSDLHPSTFCKLPSLTHLSLKQNRLSSFRFEPNCFPVLHRLDLSHNQIPTVSTEDTGLWYDSLQVIEELDVSENPFICDCKIKDFVKFLWRERDVFVNHDDTFCVSAMPADFDNESLFDVDMDADKLQCAGYGAGGLHSAYLLIALAMIGLLLLIACFLYRSGTNLLNKTLNGGNKYTVIGGYHKLNDGEVEAVVSAEFV